MVGLEAGSYEIHSLFVVDTHTVLQINPSLFVKSCLVRVEQFDLGNVLLESSVVFKDTSVVEYGRGIVHHLIFTGFEKPLELFCGSLIVIDEPGECTGH